MFLSIGVLISFVCFSACQGKHEPHEGTVHTSGSVNEQAQSEKRPAHVQFDKNIRTIFQDRKGAYWFGTNAAGLFRYADGTLRNFTAADGLSDNQVLSIQEDTAGNIWIGTGGFGVTKYDGQTFTTITRGLNVPKKSNPVWKSNKDDLWFFAGDGVFRYDYIKLHHYPFELGRTSSSSKIHDPFSLSRFAVYSTLKDRRGNLWFGTQAEGVCRFDGKHLTWFKEKGLAGSAVLGLFEDSKGNLWFGNNGAGLFRYDGETLVNITQESGFSNPDFKLSGKSGPGTLSRVYSINEDLIGNIWVGTVDAGVWKYDGNRWVNYAANDDLGLQAVNTIFSDRAGELWFGTDRNGLFKFNGSTFLPIVIP